MSAAAILKSLWDALPRECLTDELLDDLAKSEELAMDLGNLADVMVGIGCLVSTDGHRSQGHAGNFQSADSVPTLLFHLSACVAAHAAAVFVAGEAESLRAIRAQKNGGEQ